MQAQPHKSKQKRDTDTSPYKNHACQVCGKRVLLSKGSGYWRFDPSTGTVMAFHVTCLLERANA